MSSGGKWPQGDLPEGKKHGTMLKTEGESKMEHYSEVDIVNTRHQFSYENGIVVTHIEPGLARGELHAGPNSINPHGMIHGGAMATLADTVGGCCACSTGGNCVTASSSMEFLRPALGDLFCEATPKKLGNKLSVIQIVITNTQGKAVATGTFTFFMERPKQT